jgi:hypothetical protein
MQRWRSRVVVGAEHPGGKRGVRRGFAPGFDPVEDDQGPPLAGVRGGVRRAAVPVSEINCHRSVWLVAQLSRLDRRLPELWRVGGVASEWPSRTTLVASGRSPRAWPPNAVVPRSAAPSSVSACLPRTPNLDGAAELATSVVQWDGKSCRLELTSAVVCCSGRVDPH